MQTGMRVHPAEVPRVISEVFQKHELRLKGAYSDTEAWNEIFERVFGYKPVDCLDPRWDVLFDTKFGGMEALRAVPV